MVALFFRNNKRMLMGVNAVLILAVVGCVAYALRPVDIAANDKSGGVRKIKTFHIKESTLPTSVKNYSAIYARALREPLVVTASAIKTPIASAVVNKNIKMKLLGTVIESEHTYGLFEGQDGKAKLVRPGQKFNNAKVISVNEEIATLDYNGKSVVLKITKPPPGASTKPTGKKSRRPSPERRPPSNRRNSRRESRR